VLQALSPDDRIGDAPRYSDAAGVEHHPQVTDFVPRRYRTIAVLLLVCVLMTALLAVLQYSRGAISARIGIGATPFELSGSGSLGAWIKAVVLLASSAVCLLVYSIRRHRIDDFRGRYRIWLAAAVACLVTSADSVAGLHQVLADVLGNVTGWTALRDGAVWWLMLAGLPITWVVARSLMDVRESRLAAALLTLAVLCYAASTVSFLKVLSTLQPPIESIVTAAAQMMGHWLVFAAALAYARFVILDAQGLIVVRPRIVQRRRRPATKARENADESQLRSSVAGASSEGKSRSRQAVPHTTKLRPVSTQWVDGSQPEPDTYDEGDDAAGDDRKLSKSERKRLRKLKAQTRAA
jgi:hypothetical protein